MQGDVGSRHARERNEEAEAEAEARLQRRGVGASIFDERDESVQRPGCTGRQMPSEPVSMSMFMSRPVASP